MTEDIERIIRDWLETAEDLGKTGALIGDSTRDPQKKKLSFCIAREILVQCQEISAAANDLIKSMRDIREYAEGSENTQKVKTLRRR